MRGTMAMDQDILRMGVLCSKRVGEMGQRGQSDGDDVVSAKEGLCSEIRRGTNIAEVSAGG